MAGANTFQITPVYPPGRLRSTLQCTVNLPGGLLSRVFECYWYWVCRPIRAYACSGIIGGYACDAAVPASRGALENVATVVAAGDPIDLVAVLDDLSKRKVERLMVEGGGTVHTQFLSAGLVDEIQVVIAPFFVGDHAAPRFVHPGRFPQGAQRPLILAETLQMGDVVLLRYLARSGNGAQ